MQTFYIDFLINNHYLLIFIKKISPDKKNRRKKECLLAPVIDF